MGLARGCMGLEGCRGAFSSDLFGDRDVFGKAMQALLIGHVYPQSGLSVNIYIPQSAMYIRKMSIMSKVVQSSCNATRGIND